MNEYLARFRERFPQYNDMPDAELLRALHSKYYSDMPFERFAARVGVAPASSSGPAGAGPSIGPAGPTAQPAFPSLSPMKGGALDALILLGNTLALGVPAAMSETVANARRDIKDRSPRTAMGLEMGGAALAFPVAAMTGGAALRAPSAAAAMLRSPAIKGIGAGLGFGGGLAGGYAAIRRLLGGGQ